MPTLKTHKEIIDYIFELTKGGGSLPTMMTKLKSFLGDIGKEELKYYLMISGIIPERIKHDSSEEKLYSKYCEYLGYLFFNILGLKAEVIDTRSEEADVLAEKEGENNYKIVVDTKASRLSRSALNVKDYKVDSLGTTWRTKRDADYASLFNPIGFFLKKDSQLYAKAIEHNVTMISYIHLVGILSIPQIETKDLSPLWEIGKSLQSLSPKDRKNADKYWKKLDSVILSLGLDGEEWKACKKNASKQLRKIVEEELLNIENLEKEITEMDIDALRKQLIISKKYDKIKESIKDKLGIAKWLDSD